MDDAWQLKGRATVQCSSWPAHLNQTDSEPGRWSNSNLYITQQRSVIERNVCQEATSPSVNSQNLLSGAGNSHTHHPVLAMIQESPQCSQPDFHQTANSLTSYVASNPTCLTTGPANSSIAGGWPSVGFGTLPFMDRVGAIASISGIPDLSQGVPGGDTNKLPIITGPGKRESVFSRLNGVELYKTTLSMNPVMADVCVHPQYQVPLWHTSNRSPHLQSTVSEKYPTSSQTNILPPVMDNSYPKPLLRPRVFCAGMPGSVIGGELTMSEDGTLGVICFCHNLHMSVAKFSEHAGLFAVNPGGSIVMEGGETLAQWRKTFFCQFRVKVPEDHMGWDWEECRGLANNGLGSRSSQKDFESVNQGDCVVSKDKGDLYASVSLNATICSRSKIGGMGVARNELPMHMDEKVLLKSQKIVLEPCNESSCRHMALDMGQAERDLLTSNFELRLGQPSEENVSLESRLSDSLQSRVCTGLASQDKQSTYELACPPAWEQQREEHSTCQKLATCDGYMDQNNTGTFTPNLLSDKQRNRDFHDMLHVNLAHHTQLHEPHCMQASTFPDIHRMQYFVSSQTQTRNVDVASNIMLRPGAINCGERRRAQPMSLQESSITPFSVLHNDLSRSTYSNHQSSVLPIRPRVVNADSIRKGEAMLLTPYEKPRPVMGPPEIICPSSEVAAIRTSIDTEFGGTESCLTSWVRRFSYVATSESLSSCSPVKAVDHTSSTMNGPKLNEESTQQRSLVETSSECVADKVGMCRLVPSALDTCTTLTVTNEGCKSFENNQQSGNAEELMELLPKEPACFQTESAVLKVQSGRSMMIEGKSSGRGQKEDCYLECRDRTYRGLIEDLKSNEVLPNTTMNKSSSIDDSSPDEAIARNEANTHGDSVNYDATKPPVDKCSLDGSSATPKAEEHGSSKTLHGAVNSVAKGLVQNEVLHENSGVGKCCSSVEADMEAITSMGPVSLQTNAQLLESQTSIAHSSSSNAVISDTLSNSGRARNLFVEVDKAATAKGDEVGCHTGSWMQRSTKRVRKASKWKSLEASSSLEGEREENISRISVIPRKYSASDALGSVPSAGSLKCKRSGFSSVSELSCPKIFTIHAEGSSREVKKREPIIRCRVSKSVKPLEEAVGKQGRQASNLTREISNGKIKWVKYQDLISPTGSIKASSGLKNGLISAKDKARNLRLSDLNNIKPGKLMAERHNVKGVKMASLSSILKVSSSSLAFKTKVGQWRGLPPVGAPMEVHPKAILHEHTLRLKKNRKRSMWEMENNSISHAIDVPVGVTSSKFTVLGCRYSCQDTDFALNTMAHVGKTASVFGFNTKMVSVPLKFVPQKRLETEDLHRETRALVNSAVDNDPLSGGLAKGSQCQGGYPRRLTYPSIESIGFLSNNEEDEEKPIRKRKKCKKQSNSKVLKDEQSMECCVCGESSVQHGNVLVKCAWCGLGVHQACYGVVEVPRKPWICRPCKSQATDIVCVLCGYGQGAMTRAKKSGALAKGLVQAWQAEGDNNQEGLRQDPVCLKIDQPESNHDGHGDMKVLKDNGGHLVAESEVGSNSVFCGLTDPKVTQWVHVVCALWMPGTRCINLETMAAFDVSGVASSARKWVCSICKRSGGACIKCRVEKCATPFHPWCAHRKGLLQNEAFGEEEDKVGFFGRCQLHGKLAGGEEAAIEEPMET